MNHSQWANDDFEEVFSDNATNGPLSTPHNPPPRALGLGVGRKGIRMNNNAVDEDEHSQRTSQAVRNQNSKNFSLKDPSANPIAVRRKAKMTNMVSCLFLMSMTK